ADPDGPAGAADRLPDAAGIDAQPRRPVGHRLGSINPRKALQVMAEVARGSEVGRAAILAAAVAGDPFCRRERRGDRLTVGCVESEGEEAEIVAAVVT